MSTIKLAVIGGDRRQATVAAILARCGYECAAYAIDGVDVGQATKCAEPFGAVNGASAVILPLPVSRDGVCLNAPLYSGKLSLAALNNIAAEGVPFIGGMIKQSDFSGRPVYDYYANEGLQILNTVPTAEGAIAIGMEALPTTLHGTKALVMGFGRVGKTLSLMLKGLGVLVSVATRNPTEKALCAVLGFDTVEYSGLPEEISRYGLIYNTVPALLLTKELLEGVQPSTPVIDLATHPGGVDAVAAKSMGKNVIWALGLPGKVAPVTAGEYIAKTVISILKEEHIV